MIRCSKCGCTQPFTALRNVRRWPGAGIEIGECQQSYRDSVCNSTLSREVDFNDEPPTAVEDYEPIGREAVRQREAGA